MRLSLVLLAAASQMAFSQVPARQVNSDSSMSRILAQTAQAIADKRLLVSVLRNESGKFAASQRDALADALINRVLANRAEPGSVSDSANYGAAVRALEVLGRAGSSQLESSASVSGEPYPGASSRLERAYRDAPVREIRARALALTLSTADRSRALAFVARAAEAPDMSALDAVQALIQDAAGLSRNSQQTAADRQESMATLRELSVNHRIRNPVAAGQAASWVGKQKP